MMEKKNNAKLQNKYEKVHSMTFVMSILKPFYFLNITFFHGAFIGSPCFAGAQARPCPCHPRWRRCWLCPPQQWCSLSCWSCFPSSAAGISISGMQGEPNLCQPEWGNVHLLCAGLEFHRRRWLQSRCLNPGYTMAIYSEAVVEEL